MATIPAVLDNFDKTISAYKGPSRKGTRIYSMMVNNDASTHLVAPALFTTLDTAEDSTAKRSRTRGSDKRAYNNTIESPQILGCNKSKAPHDEHASTPTSERTLDSS
jgi:hypothetical protein